MKPDLNDPTTTNEDIGRWLREQPVADRVDFLCDWFRRNPSAGLDLGRRLDLRRRDARQVVEDTVDDADAGSMRYWIEFYVTVAGLRAAAQLLREWDSAGLTDRVGKARYWLVNVPEARTPVGKAVLDEIFGQSRNQ